MHYRVYRACKGVTRAGEKRGSIRVLTGLLQGFVREKVYWAYRIRGLRSREINKITLVPYQATEALIAILTEPESPNGCSFTGSWKGSTRLHGDFGGLDPCKRAMVNRINMATID